MSRLFFVFVNDLIKLGYRKHLEQADLWDVAHQDEALPVATRFKEELEKTEHPTRSPRGSIWQTIARLHRRTFLITAIIKIVHDIIMFASPALLELLLTHLAAGSSGWLSVALGLAMLCCALLETLTINQYFLLLFRMTLHVKTGLVATLYDKTLRITSGIKSEMGVGAIVNLQSNDASKIWGLPQYLHILWNGPFQILVVMGMLVRILGLLSSLSALLVTVALIPISTLVGRALAKARRDMVQYTDARVKLASEIVTGIKAIKLYAWEEPYVQRISELRDRELRAIRKTQTLSLVNTVAYQSGPVLVALAAFGTYTMLGKQLTASVAFPALALFNLLRFPIIMFPTQIMNIVHARVGLQRIQKFMECQEMEDSLGNKHGMHDAYFDANNSRDVDLNARVSFPGVRGKSVRTRQSQELGKETAILLRGADFAYQVHADPVLSQINLKVPRGRLVMVVGEVGSGKSSLLAAILGEINRLRGEVQVMGSIAYTAQDPWIQNSTLRQNILMGSEYDEDRYASTLAACALGPDLEMLPAGDVSEIGEKGINLSGGQKHRVALARAVYAHADIYLLDDPLSAVDAHVGRHLFDKCICRYLEATTRVLVTHQLQYLPAADWVVVISQGRITHQGRYQELVDQGVDLHKYTAKHDEGKEETHVRHAGVTRSGASLSMDGGQAGEVIHETIHLGIDSGDDSGASSLGGSSKAPLVGGLVELQPTSSNQNAAMRETVEEDQSAPGSLAVGVQLDNTAVLLRSEVREEDGQQEEAVQTSLGSRGSVSAFCQLDRRSVSLELQRESLKRSLSKGKDGKISKVEERSVGSVDRAVYKQYLAAWGKYFLLPTALVAAAFMERSLQVGQNFTLSSWSNQTTQKQKGESSHQATSHNMYFMTVYFILGLSSMVMGLIKTGVIIMGSISASRTLHRQLLAKVVRLPMSFFDSQPTGRLLNRFTKDTEAVDLQLAGSFQSALNCFVNACLSLMVVMSVSPGTILAVIPLAYIYYRVQGVFIATSRELKRLDSLAYSPIFQNFSETLSGLQTIRAFRKEEMFRRKNLENMDNSNRAYWPIQVANRWLSIRLELMGAVIVFCSVVFVSVVLPRNAGLAGLALTSALNLTGIMNWMVRQTTELEVNMNAVERMVEYKKYEEEAPPVVPGHRPPRDWPSQGSILVEQLVVKYRPELDPVLKGLSFKVEGCEKIGVCGRTGCGKSTLMMTLYRIVEPTSGRVVIDGVDTSAIGLADLRSRLSLVPQDPVIFSGTIRSNLDPFGQAPSDHAVWEALRRAGMGAYVRELGQGLDSPLQEGGANLSVGQRQLLCMARALLRASKILVLDEATSNVDNATDALIQQTVRVAFKNCTVLTIAHRLHTILDSDRILLLDSGEVDEFDSPLTLLQTPGSAFRAMVDEAWRVSHRGAERQEMLE